MKILITLAIFFVIIATSWAQNPDYDENYTNGYSYDPVRSPFMLSGNWAQLPNSPSALSRSCCAYIEIAGVPYLYQFGGGNTSSELKRVSRLNLQTNTWQYNYSTMPTQISAGTAITINNTDIYVFGGNNVPGTLGKTLKYNAASNSWQTKSDMPTKITDALVVKYSESKIILIGGGDGYFGSSALKTNKVQIYNVSNDSYSYSNDLPMPISMMGGGVYRDTIITAGGYTTGGVSINNCYKGVINPNNMSITWTNLPTYPSGPICRLASYTAVKNTGVGIVFTGGAIGGSVPTSQTNFWNFCTQSWQTGLPDNNEPRSNYKATGKGLDIVYAVGGYLTNTSSSTAESLTFTHIDGPCMNMVGIINNSIPEKYELKQNYPNPFNPETKISFSLPNANKVSIIVTDIAGEKVQDLVNGVYSAGNHTISFNGENLASGIYFYTINTGDFKETRKMLLIK